MKSAKLVLLAAAWGVVSFTGCAKSTPVPEPEPPPTGPDPVYDLRIDFTQPGVFYLDETREIAYTFPGDKPESVTLNGVTDGWSVVNGAGKFIVTCEAGCPENNREITVGIVMKAGETEKTASLSLSTNRMLLFSDATAAAAEWGGGEGTEASPWEIRTAGQLKRLAARVNDGVDPDSFAGKYFKLMVDVEVAAAVWEPIGNDRNDENGRYFSGSFDGNGKTVSGELKGDNHVFGLFGNLKDRAVVRDLTVAADVTNSYTVAYSDAVKFAMTGAIAGNVSLDSFVTISGCSVSGTVKSSVTDAGNSLHTGGIVGVVDGWSEGVVTENTISSCAFTGTVRTVNVGGVLPAGAEVGGIAGALYSGVVSECTVSGATISCSDASYIYAGGITAHNRGASIVNSEVTGGSVSSGSTGGLRNYVGGVVGYHEDFSDSVVSGCTVSGGSVASGTSGGGSQAGGIVGASNGNFSGCVSSAAVSAGQAGSGQGHSSAAGGIAGVIFGTVHDCTNSGTAAIRAGVTSTAYTGGIAGRVDGAVYACCVNNGTPAAAVGYPAGYEFAVCGETPAASYHAPAARETRASENAPSGSNRLNSAERGTMFDW